jgi:hypothetical protein
VRDSAPIRGRLGRGAAACAALGALWLAACALPHPPPPPPAPPAAAPEPAVPPPAPPPQAAVRGPSERLGAADLVARHLLTYHERLRQMSNSDVAAEIARLSAQVSSADSPASPDDVMALALALAQQHNPGDLARASSLMEPLLQETSPEPPWQPMARLLAGSIVEQRRLEDQVDKMTAQRRDTQRAIQQLTEKLEALKAIERSMTAHPPGAPGSGAASGDPVAPPAPPPPPRTP